MPTAPEVHLRHVTLVLADVGEQIQWWVVGLGEVVSGRLATEPRQIAALAAAARASLDRGLPGAESYWRTISKELLWPISTDVPGVSTADSLTIVAPPSLRNVPWAALTWPGYGKRPIGVEIPVASAGSLAGVRPVGDVRAQSGQVVALVPRAGAHAHEEARTLQRLDAQVFLGAQATRDRFLSSSAGARLIHFGGHVSATVNRTAEMRFAGLRRAQTTLHATAIARLELSGATVVLLGCATAEAPQVRSTLEEGLFTLADAFVHAGSRGVVATLWPLSDRRAAEVAALLYREPSVVPTAASIRDIRAELHRRYPNDPARWANLVWIGTAY